MVGFDLECLEYLANEQNNQEEITTETESESESSSESDDEETPAADTEISNKLSLNLDNMSLKKNKPLIEELN